MSVIFINPYRFGVTDPNFANVSLLLHGDGTNGSTTITDSSPSPKAVTAVGNAQISTAQSKFGGASIAFDGTADYLTTTSSDFSLGSENFTWEGWFYFANGSENAIRIMLANYNVFSAQSIFWGKHTAVGGRIAVFVHNVNAFSALISESTHPPSSTWIHCALVRNANILTMYRNGVQTASASITVASTTNSLLNVGGNTESSGVFSHNGFIDELRITRGIARYTADFTPPAAPFPDA